MNPLSYAERLVNYVAEFPEIIFTFRREILDIISKQLRVVCESSADDREICYAILFAIQSSSTLATLDTHQLFIRHIHENIPQDITYPVERPTTSEDLVQNFVYFQQYVRTCTKGGDEGVPTLYGSMFSSVKKIKVYSKYGMAFVASNVFNSFHAVIKCTKTQEDTTIHELAVGYALNCLRAQIPYFSFMYGGFYSSKLATNATQCKRNPDAVAIPYTVQEFAYDAVEFENFHWEVEELHELLYSLFSQVAHALDVAQQAFKYMHFDLHGGNVLVRRSPGIDEHEKIQIKIIDYGTNALYVTDTMFLSCSSKPDPFPQTIKDLRTDPARYFVPTYDIFRYVVFTLCMLYDNYSCNAQVVAVIEAMYARCMGPFFSSSSSSTSTTVLQQALQQRTFVSMYEAESQDSTAILDVYLDELDVFQVSMQEWLSHFRNYL